MVQILPPLLNFKMQTITSPARERINRRRFCNLINLAQELNRERGDPYLVRDPENASDSETFRPAGISESFSLSPRDWKSYFPAIRVDALRNYVEVGGERNLEFSQELARRFEGNGEGEFVVDLTRTEMGSYTR
jgi:hypothetical protein